MFKGLSNYEGAVNLAILTYQSLVTALTIAFKTCVQEVVDLCLSDLSEVHRLITSWGCKALQLF